MFTVTEVAGGSQQPSATQQLQMQLASNAAMVQQIAAMQQGDSAGDAGTQGSGAQPDTTKQARVKENAADDTRPADTEPESKASSEAAARSVVEAREASKIDKTIMAAFQARYALTDLLSVIRDPEDLLLPTAPSKSAA